MTLSIAALVAVNLIPLVGVLFLDWDIGPVLMLYWSENLVLGGYNVLKIMLRPAEHPIVYLGRLFPSAFFCFHYGAFCGVHGLFLLAFLETDGMDDVMGGDLWPLFLAFVHILIRTIQAAWSLYSDVLLWPWVALVLSHGISFVQNFVGKKEFERFTTEQLMQQPYKRIVLLHVAIIAGGFGVMALGSPLPLLMLIVVGKIALDIHLHRREHRPKEENLTPTESTEKP